ncbi:hypothetical protein [Corallococcus terminator]|uniref:Uncharacterized protein n=1 Tax=Corallococcus terminator TaxID=2316733 RepID=A0A3A8IBY9_9BACT|nr:hypothetical protein [Corallococcus terminator]RKG80186.1 hypothetical protein D7V88_27865 [Corallococcus terminator]
MASSFPRVPWCFLLLALAGCEPALPEGAEVGGSDIASGTSEAEIRIANSLTTRELVLNAIAANHAANEALATHSLESLFDPDAMVAGPESALIANQLRDPYAQRFMEYLVGCALKANESLAWLNPLHPTNSQLSHWQGGAGLCPQWRTSAPSEDSACLKRVTACLLARNNALGYRVGLSMRGEIHEPLLSIAEPFALDAWAAPLDHIQGSAASVNSSAPCSGTAVGAGRDCGWTMHSVGWCPAGQTVSVGAGGPTGGPSACGVGAPLGASADARMVMRVCSGISGCDSTSAELMEASEGCLPGSSSPWPTAITNPSVSITCPAQGGYFTVMTAPWNSTASGRVTVAVTGTAQLPLSERGVYRIREGAFYGSMFGPGALRDDIDVQVVNVTRDRYAIKRPEQRQVKPIFNNLYSCYDPGWVHGLAYATYRVCALPGTHEDCAATVTGPCWGAADEKQCAAQDGSLFLGDGDFVACLNPAGDVWTEPVTVFLNGSCDLVDEQHSDLCARWSEPQPPRKEYTGRVTVPVPAPVPVPGPGTDPKVPTPKVPEKR